MIHRRVLHVVVCISNLLLSLPSNSLLYWCTTVIHSLVEGYLGHLEFLAVTVNCTVNKKTVNICRFLLNISFISLEKTLGMGLLGPRQIYATLYKKLSNHFLEWLYHFAFPSELQLLCILPST